MKYFIFLIAMAITIASCSTNGADKKSTVPAAAKPQYQLAPVEKGGVSSTIKLPAQLAAYQEVSIFPKVNGYVKTVAVDIGDKVAKGKLLMTLDAPELLEAAIQAKEKYARTKVEYSIDKERYLRLLEASKTAGAISPLDLSTVKSKMEADSILCNAEKANWDLQQTMLEYLHVTAPFSGVITERNIHPGALVNAASKDKPMLELKQTDHLRLQLDIPEVLAAQIRNKDTVSFFVSALQGKKLTGYINRSSNNINPTYRNERMEVDVPNPNGLLSPGMFANVVLYAAGNVEALYVPKTAVVTSTERKYVLVMKAHTLQKIDVTTGNASADKIEVYGALQAGDQVVAVANDEM